MEVALRREKPDVVVGSSWGGAVALKCIEQGYWAGPAVLLAPAISARGVWNLAWPSFEPELPAAAAARVLVVQGDRDDTCLLYTSPSPRDYAASRMPSSA